MGEGDWAGWQCFFIEVRLYVEVLTIRMIRTYNTHGVVPSLNSVITSDNAR